MVGEHLLIATSRSFCPFLNLSLSPSILTDVWLSLHQEGST